ncbi:MAG: hypothetical protein Q8O64_04930 [Sideroxyarcus sp.]|nr:hypothetical protein [Sideroxyarcus sp.]
MQMKVGLNSPAKPRGPLGKLVALIVAVAMFALVLMFSAVLLAVILVVGAIAGIYLWWKTRELRKMMKDFPPPEAQREQMASNNAVFEGEVIRVVEPIDVK